MNDLESNYYYHKTGKVPPLTLLTWVNVYQILVNQTCDPIKGKNI